jgi:diguanylate cyclase (GGDEF)-like protein
LAPALDPLTWLPNHALFRARVEQVLAAGSQPRVALLHLDLDRFRDVNDLLGDDTGDLVLREAAARLSRFCPRRALLGYLGGDDFAALVEAAELPHAARLARALVEACREPFVVDCLSLRLTASVGFALYSSRAPNAASLIAHAGDALFRAKVAGRDRCYPGRLPQG